MTFIPSSNRDKLSLVRACVDPADRINYALDSILPPEPTSSYDMVEIIQVSYLSLSLIQSLYIR